MPLSPRDRSDLRLLSWGAYAPLASFTGEADHRSISGRSPDPEVYRTEPATDVKSLFGTDDPAHPGVAAVLEAGPWRLGGTAQVNADLSLAAPFDRHPSTPAAVKAAIAERGWKRVVFFQTRNPIHRAHEYLTKCALETVDGLVIHPLVGETKEGDVSADVRLRCYEVLLEFLLPARPGHAGALRCPHALRRAQGGGAARAGASQLRRHSLHRRARPRRCGQLLRHLRVPARQVRAPSRVGHQAARDAVRRGAPVLCSVIAPYRSVREEVRALHARQAAGEISGLTGVDDAYEPPTDPEVTVATQGESVEESAEAVWQALHAR